MSESQVLFVIITFLFTYLFLFNLKLVTNLTTTKHESSDNIFKKQQKHIQLFWQ